LTNLEGLPKGRPSFFGLPPIQPPSLPLTKALFGEKSSLMPAKRPFLLYLRSGLNMRISAIAAGLIVLSLIFLGPRLFIAALAIIGVYALVTFLLFFSRRGAAEVVQESEEDRLKKAREKIAAYARMREKLSFLRIGDDGMRKALEYFLLQSGTYIEKCREMDLYSPRANKRIEDVQEICQAFLGELDEGSTERRYGVKEGESAEDFKKRSIEAVMHAGSDIRAYITDDLLGVSGEDKLSIIEELEGKK
jgi:hypothetical protein